MGRIWNNGQTESLAHYQARVLADVTLARQRIGDQLGEPDVDSLCYRS